MISEQLCPSKVGKCPEPDDECSQISFALIRKWWRKSFSLRQAENFLSHTNRNGCLIKVRELAERMSIRQQGQSELYITPDGTGDTKLYGTAAINCLKWGKNSISKRFARCVSSLGLKIIFSEKREARQPPELEAVKFKGPKLSTAAKNFLLMVTRGRQMKLFGEWRLKVSRTSWLLGENWNVLGWHALSRISKIFKVTLTCWK